MLPLDRPDEVEVMAAFRPDSPIVYPEEVLVQVPVPGPRRAKTTCWRDQCLSS